MKTRSSVLPETPQNLRDFNGHFVSSGMKRLFLILSLAALTSATMVAAPGAPQIVGSGENPALMVTDARIDPRDGKIRGTVYLRFGYSAPLLTHVHVYGMNASGQVAAEACDKLSSFILSNPRLAGKSHDGFSANLGSLAGITTLQVVASSGHSTDCKMEDNRIFKLF